MSVLNQASCYYSLPELDTFIAQLHFLSIHRRGLLNQCRYLLVIVNHWDVISTSAVGEVSNHCRGLEVVVEGTITIPDLPTLLIDIVCWLLPIIALLGIVTWRSNLPEVREGIVAVGAWSKLFITDSISTQATSGDVEGGFRCCWFAAAREASIELLSSFFRCCTGVALPIEPAVFPGRAYGVGLDEIVDASFHDFHGMVKLAGCSHLSVVLDDAPRHHVNGSTDTWPVEAQPNIAQSASSEIPRCRKKMAIRRFSERRPSSDIPSVRDRLLRSEPRAERVSAVVVMHAN
ncbi:hypothetical protein ACLOJK_023959 [Asimina triloba]